MRDIQIFLRVKWGVFAKSMNKSHQKERKIIMTIKKTLYLCLAMLFLFRFPVYAAGDPACNWYCKRQKNHIRPAAECNMAYIAECGGVFLGEDPEEKVIYLTFDAGYENGNIARILDTLKKHEATGAFFILENLIVRNADLVSRMAQEGHLLCNHTAHHKDMTKLGNADLEAELHALEAICLEKTGYSLSKFYRPPEGRFNRRNLEHASSLGYMTVFWSLAYADWDNDKQPDPTYAKNLLLENTHNGAIVLLHPTSKTNADILDDLLTAWENEGYRFGSLTDFLARD